jgi:Ca-activated chloride channel family protein
MKRLALLLLAVVALAPERDSGADAGALIPFAESVGSGRPAPVILRNMDVTVTIQDQHAEVRVSQIFANPTDQVIEARYVFPLGEHATVKDFALWEGDSRMQGTIVEKMRGKQIYQDLTRQNVDPGLLETSDDKKEQGIFSLKIAPIPAYGTSRVEIVYEETLPLASLGSQFVLPLKPRRWKAQSVENFSITIDVKSSGALAKTVALPAAWFAGQQASHLRYAAKKVTLADDVSVEMTAAQPKTGVVAASMLAYRDTRAVKDLSALGGGVTRKDEAGYFVARALFSSGAAAPARKRDLVILLDASLSMQWDKLEVAVHALEEFLKQRLTPDDRFDVVLFHDEIRPWKPELQPGTKDNATDALRFVRAGYLSGGTDLQGALTAAATILARSPRPGADRDVLMITDGHPTWGEVQYKKIGDATAPLWTPGTRLFVLGIGDDVNETLLGALTRASGGAFAHAREAGDASFVLRTFFDKLSHGVYRDVDFISPKAAQVHSIYPQHASAFDGSSVELFGKYDIPQTGTSVAVRAKTEDGKSVETTIPASFPDVDTQNPWIGRAWASLRVADLLDQIRTYGEREDWVDEIIALAKRWKLVTPYTSFIAAPRAMLRPRNFQAGDPLLRVKTGPEIQAVAVVFPFGLTKELTYLKDEDVWETRFLAPAWMTDGAYQCTLVLTDTAGRKLREDKSFVIDSSPPKLAITLGAGMVRPGDRVTVTARASKDTRWIRARLDEGPAADVRWSSADQASVGELAIPADLKAGTHRIHVVAEDFAHNTTIETVEISVVE